MTKNNKALILFADDDKFLCVTVTQYLRNLGFDAIATQDGMSALTLFKERKPDLAIVDLIMPEMSGDQFIQEARKIDPIIPILIITGKPTLDSVIETMQEGAADYIRKPFELKELEAKINRALDTFRLKKENMILSELVSLNELSLFLSSTHDLNEILQKSAEFTCDVLHTESSSIRINTDNNDLPYHSLEALAVKHDEFTLESNVTRWVDNEVQRVITTGESVIGVTDHPTKERKIFLLVIPIHTMGQVMGTITLIRDDEEAYSFNVVNENLVKLLAQQIGNAISNAKLYTSLNQKVEDLYTVSQYAGNIVSMERSSSVISYMGEIIKEHFSMDFIGVLSPQGRKYKYHYWSSFKDVTTVLDSTIEKVLDYYNMMTFNEISPSKVISEPLKIETFEQPSGVQEAPLHYEKCFILSNDDHDLGALFIGSTKEISSERQTLLDSLVHQTQIALSDNASFFSLKDNYLKTIRALAVAVDAKDSYTHGHSKYVMIVSELIAREMNLSAEMVQVIRDGALLHDIGKIGIPGYILNKPGPLTKEEFHGVMKNHPSLGGKIIEGVPFLKDIYACVCYHHENYDGTGYPEGLKGDEIPLSAQIVHVADAYDAMTSHRPYRKGISKDEALGRLIEGKGSQFNPVIVDALIAATKKNDWFEQPAAFTKY